MSVYTMAGGILDVGRGRVRVFNVGEVAACWVTRRTRADAMPIPSYFGCFHHTLLSQLCLLLAIKMHNAFMNRSLTMETSQNHLSPWT
jgi:hypothetical protein